MSDDKEETVAEVNKDLIDADVTELDLTHTRQKQISGFERFTKLTILQLRWNLITKIENLSPLAATLVELDLYDNQIEKIENLDELVNLRTLDLSFNRITKIEGLENLVNLETLYLTHNKIKKIEGLNQLKKLECVELGDNRIAKIEKLDENVELCRLYLGANRIEKIENIAGLVKLEVLCIPANGISIIEELDTLVNLKELSLSQNNKIEEIGDALKNNTKLSLLDLDTCGIRRISGLSHLDNLVDLYMQDNQLEDWSDTKELVNLPNLNNVSLANNPFSRDVNYRRRAIQTFPQVSEVDGLFCRN